MEHSEKILKTLKVLNNHIVKMIDGDISDRTAAQYDFAEEIVKLFSLPDVNKGEAEQVCKNKDTKKKVNLDDRFDDLYGY